MSNILVIPEFKSEAEEAAWWNSHPDQILAAFKYAAKDGTLGRGTLKRRAQAPAPPQLQPRRVGPSTTGSTDTHQLSSHLESEA